MAEYEQAVFISYAWGGEREEIVNQIDQALQARGLKIIRDKRDLGFKGSISEFMERIGRGNCVIIVISDKYLRSKNCMFELVEIAENKQFADRIFPVILSDAKIYDAVERLDYVEHWEKEKAKLSEKIRSLSDISNLQGIHEELNNYDRFRDRISGLTSLLKDMNTLTPDIHRDSDFLQLYDALIQRMQNAVATSHPEKPSSLKKERKPMDPITLATAATTLLAPFIKKAGEKALDKLADQLPEAAGKVWSAIAERFKDKPAVEEAAVELVKDPENVDNEVYFKMQLKKALEKDEAFASKLTEVMEQAKGDSSINIGGDGVVATNNSTAVGQISIGGNVSGGFVIGNNNQISNK